MSQFYTRKPPLLLQEQHVPSNRSLKIKTPLIVEVSIHLLGNLYIYIYITITYVLTDVIIALPFFPLKAPGNGCCLLLLNRCAFGDWFRVSSFILPINPMLSNSLLSFSVIIQSFSFTVIFSSYNLVIVWLHFTTTFYLNVYNLGRYKKES
jgi:hypothetical protein